jgi:hypothetical protein
MNNRHASRFWRTTQKRRTEMIKVIMPIVGILLIISGVVFALCQSPVQLPYDYSTKISVNKPDKIENAISNVVSDLEKRDFVPVHLEVNWHPLGKTYVIYAKGIDRTKLGSLVGNVQEK